ncbi:MAG: UPF0104 family protein [Leptolyngbyaceae cyanobacterium SL_7_1]|nr:UPF0104 family protein [Leptolyngbyaceae cyanobacterium SL_7_1]
MLKPYLSWVILGGTLFFLATTLRIHWREVVEIRVSQTGWLYLSIALLMTLLAHIWSGWVWSWILRSLHQPAQGMWGVLTYLKTNIAKYLPGNVWHFYGRVMASKAQGFSVGAATVSVVLEALLMAAAALLLALCSYQTNLGLSLLALAGVLVGVHPRLLNPLIKLAAQAKRQGQEEHPLVRLDRYPVVPLLGELGFLGLRGLGFLAIVLALMGTQPFPMLPVLSAFSIAWMLGLVVPGAPGGIGVFEASMVALVDALLPTGILLAAVAFYRFISTSAEAIGAGLAYGYEHFGDRDFNSTDKH